MIEQSEKRRMADEFAGFTSEHIELWGNSFPVSSRRAAKRDGFEAGFDAGIAWAVEMLRSEELNNIVISSAPNGLIATPRSLADWIEARAKEKS